MTQEEIDQFNERQNRGDIYPYTCLYDGDKKHIEYEFRKLFPVEDYEEYIKEQKEKFNVPYPHMVFMETLMIATKDGIQCPCCGWKQKIK